MQKIKKILIATDLSPLSLNAIEKGLKLAKKYDANLTILHVLEKGFFDELRKNVLKPIQYQLIGSREYANKIIIDKIKKISDPTKKLEVKIVSTKSKTANYIVKFAKKNKIDLMLLGAHGKFTFHDWFVGTTTEYVAKRTECPLLIVKDSKKKKYANILLPIDFSNLNKLTIQLGVELFPTSQFQILHVGDAAYDELLKIQSKSDSSAKDLRLKIIDILQEKTKNFASSTGTNKANFSFKIKLGHPGLEILDEANKKNIDLVIMGTQGHNQYYYKWLGSITNRVLIEVNKDILLIPPARVRRSKRKNIQTPEYLKKITLLTEEHFQQLKQL